MAIQAVLSWSEPWSEPVFPWFERVRMQIPVAKRLWPVLVSQTVSWLVRGRFHVETKVRYVEKNVVYVENHWVYVECFFGVSQCSTSLHVHVENMPFYVESQLKLWLSGKLRTVSPPHRTRLGRSLWCGQEYDTILL